MPFMADITTTFKYRCDLDRGPCEADLPRPLMHTDALADTFCVAVRRGMKPVMLTGMTVRGFMCFHAARQTLPLRGTCDGNTACVTLTDECYAVPGGFSLVIQLESGDVRHTLLRVNGMVSRVCTDSVIDPEDIVPTLPELLAQIDAMREATELARATADMAIRTDTPQSLTSSQQMQARLNADAAGTDNLNQIYQLLETAGLVTNPYSADTQGDLDAGGAETDSSTHCRTGYIPKETDVFICKPAGYQARVYYYTDESADSFLGFTSLATESAALTTAALLLLLKPGAKYLRLTCAIGDDDAWELTPAQAAAAGLRIVRLTDLRVLGDPNQLITSDKSTLVAAINEAALAGGGAGIDDSAESVTSTWSSQKIKTGLDNLLTLHSADYEYLNGRIGDLTQLTTTDKSSLAAAINELAETAAAGGEGAGIDDDTQTLSATWSSSKIAAELNKLVVTTGVDGIPVNFDHWTDKTPLTNQVLDAIKSDGSIPYGDSGTYYLFAAAVEAGCSYQFSRSADNLTWLAQNMWKIAFSSTYPVNDPDSSQFTASLVGSILTSNKAVFTVPAGAQYVLFVIKVSAYDAFVSGGVAVTLQKITDSHPTPSYPIETETLQVLKPEIGVPASAVYADDTPRIEAWGDSLTAGAGTTRSGDDYPDSYPSVLRSLIGSAVYNMGVGGEAIETILGRQGSLPMLVQPDFTIPADTTAVEVTLQSITGAEAAPLRQYRDFDKGVNPCSIAGIAGTLTYDEDTGAYSFTRAAAGNAMTIKRPTPLVTAGMQTVCNNRILLMWLGQNNAGDIDPADVDLFAQRMVDVHRAAIAHAGTDRYIILGAPIDEPNAHDTSVYAPLYQRMQYAFGAHYINIVDHLIAYGLADAGLTATEEDTANIAAHRIPASLRADSVHLNAAGYRVVAEQVYSRGQTLGYW